MFNVQKITLILLATLGVSTAAAQTDFSLENIRRIGLPVVEITTADGVEPTCDYVTHPDGSFGEGITNCTKVACRVVITRQGETLYDSGEYQKNVSGATIKINGNTSAYHDNKPYKVKLEKKGDLLCRGDSKYDDKEWKLSKDARSLRTIIGLKMNELMGLPWTPAYEPCNVFVNGDYRGCYLLMESVKRNSGCRLDVDKATGYIVERDPYWWNEDVWFETNFYSPNNYYRWTWKYPDEDDVTAEQTEYIRNYINEAEQSIADGNYEQYIDVGSFAAWLLSHDMMGTWDSGGANIFVMKYDNTPSSLLQMANMWDFDSIFWLDKGTLARVHTSAIDFYFYQLLNSSNKAFARAYKQKWESVKNTVPQQIMAFVKDFANSEEGRALQTSREYYTQRWNKALASVDEDVAEMEDWFDGHLPLLDRIIQNIDDGTNGIRKVENGGEESGALYDLMGRKAAAPRHGIYVSQGKKVAHRK